MRFWRNTTVATLAPGETGDARRRHPRLRVGRGSGQRLPPAGLIRLSSTTVDVAEHAPRLRLELRARHRDPPPDPVPRCQRRAGLRRRHRAVVLGARRQPRPRRLDPGPADAAGDGQPVRRHGRPARHACRRTWSRPPPRPTPRRRRRRSPSRRRAPTSKAAQPITDQRHRHRRRRRGAGRRRRGLHRRRRHLAPGRRAGRTGPTPGPRATLGAATIRARAVDDSGNLETPGDQVDGQRRPPRPAPARSGTTRSHRVGRRPDSARSRSGSSSAPTVAGYITGAPLLQDSRQHRHPRRPPLDRATGRSSPRRPSPARRASGWQQVSFDTPVAINANTTYVASYYAPNGHYAADATATSASSASTTLRCTPSPTGSTGPTGSTNTGPRRALRRRRATTASATTNYWVDVVFANTVAPDTTPPTISSRTSRRAARRSQYRRTNVRRRPSASRWTPATIDGATVELRDPGNALVPATVSYEPRPSARSRSPRAARCRARSTYTAKIKGGAGGRHRPGRKPARR